MVRGIYFSNVFFFGEEKRVDDMTGVQQMFCLPLLLCIMTDVVLAPPRKKQGGIMGLWCFSIVQLDLVH